MLTAKGVPSTGHSWLAPLEAFIGFLLADATGGLNFLAVDFLTLNALPANVYANGASGVGATLTGSANGPLVTAEGDTPGINQLVLVGGEATPANNGLYKLTQPGSVAGALPYILTRFSGFTAANNNGNAVPAWDASAAWTPGTIFGVKSGAYAKKTAVYPGPASPTVGTTAVSFALAPKPVLYRGVVASARLVFTVQPANTNTVVIGAQTFIFVSALGAATANVQVLIGAAAANTLTNLVNAVNNDPGSKGTTWVEATTPNTPAVHAYKFPATSFCLKAAVSRGGAPVQGPGPNVALSTTIAGGAVWSLANLNLSGKLDTDTQEASGGMTVTAAMITAGYLDFDLPFVPSIFSVDCFSSGGVKRAYSDVTTIVNNGDGTGGIHIVLGGGVSPNIQANDVLSWWAQQ